MYEVENGTPANQIVVVGAGQGGAVALSLLRYLEELSGVIGMPFFSQHRLSSMKTPSFSR
jgi:predicted esterase